MEDETDDSRTRVRLSSQSAMRNGSQSYLTEPKSAGTSLDDMMERMRRDIAAGIYRLRPEKSRSDDGNEPQSFSPFDSQLEGSLCDFDYTYHIGTQPALPNSIAMSDSGTQQSNALDLTKISSQSMPNRPTKRHKTDRRQTNAGHARSPSPTLSRPRSLSTFSQPKQRHSHQRTQSRLSQASPRARLQPIPNTKMAKLRVQATAKTANKQSPQRPAAKNIERNFEDLTNDSDPELPVQLKSNLPSKIIEKMSKQPIFARTKPDSSSAVNKRQRSVRPSFVRQDSMPSLLDSEDELNDVHMFNTRSPFRSPTTKEKPFTEASQSLPSPTSSQRPVPTQATVPTPCDDTFPNDFSVQRELCVSLRPLMELLIMTVSTQIHSYMEEAVGKVDDRVHRIFKDVTLITSLWVVSL